MATKSLILADFKMLNQSNVRVLFQPSGYKYVFLLVLLINMWIFSLQWNSEHCSRMCYIRINYVLIYRRIFTLKTDSNIPFFMLPNQ